MLLVPPLLQLNTQQKKILEFRVGSGIFQRVWLLEMSFLHSCKLERGSVILVHARVERHLISIFNTRHLWRHRRPSHYRLCFALTLLSSFYLLLSIVWSVTLWTDGRTHTHLQLYNRCHLLHIWISKFYSVCQHQQLQLLHGWPLCSYGMLDLCSSFYFWFLSRVNTAVHVAHVSI